MKTTHSCLLTLFLTLNTLNVQAQASAAKAAWICSLTYTQIVSRPDPNTARYETNRTHLTLLREEHRLDDVTATWFVNSRNMYGKGIKIRGHNRKYSRWDVPSGLNHPQFHSYVREDFEVMSFDARGNWLEVRTNRIKETNFVYLINKVKAIVGKEITKTTEGEKIETTASKTFKCENYSPLAVRYNFPFIYYMGTLERLYPKTVTIQSGWTIDVVPEPRWAPVPVRFINISDLPPAPYPAPPKPLRVKSGPDH